MEDVSCEFRSVEVLHEDVRIDFIGAASNEEERVVEVLLY